MAHGGGQRGQYPAAVIEREGDKRAISCPRAEDDLRDFANYVYQGNMLLLDFSAIANDEIILRRVTGDLKKLIADINGDIAGLGKTMLIVAPTGVKIDRHKARGGR